MLRIRQVRGVSTPGDKQTVAEVQAILREQFPGLRKKDVDKLPLQLRDPLKFRFVTDLLVAEDRRGAVRAFAILLYLTDLSVAYLETISAAVGRTGGGLGAALYDSVREAARSLGAHGLYFECLPDDPALSPDPKVRRQNEARLRFYERFGARPIAGTLYETPITPGATDSPYLMFDGLGENRLPDSAAAQAIVRAILERKYGDVCPPDYIERVTGSFRKGKFRLRPPRYRADDRTEDALAVAGAPGLRVKIPLIVNDRHDIHHVRERGYVEAPARVNAILRELDRTDHFEPMPARTFADRWIREVHDGGLVDYVREACAEAPLNKSVYPYVFPVRNPNRKPRERSVLSGYWCIDTFTPINRNAYPAARHAVDCALTAADEVLSGRPAAYALVRPPGHHAERRTFGGFCYFSNAAIAANYLSRHGRVAILDIDYHHGNGQQDIFYERSDVLTVSIHGSPSFAYPYFTGFRDERGRGRGAGFNLNIPLRETATPDEHRAAVAQALRRIARHEPDFLVIALGYDTAKGDPTGTWSNTAADFRKLGDLIGNAGYPTAVIQEGGYRIRTLGTNARNFFDGLASGLANAKPVRRGRPQAPPPSAVPDLVWRDSVRDSDVEPIRRLVVGTGMFTTDEVDIAVELATERISRGRASGYEFLIAEDRGKMVGYACYGPTPCTERTYDLYWIVVDADAQGRGIGRALLDRSEAAIAALGGASVYVDTSSTDKYRPTRAFYRRTGFRKVAELRDFYRAGDHKVMYVKDLPPHPGMPAVGMASVRRDGSRNTG